MGLEKLGKEKYSQYILGGGLRIFPFKIIF